MWQFRIFFYKKEHPRILEKSMALVKIPKLDRTKLGNLRSNQNSRIPNKPDDSITIKL